MLALVGGSVLGAHLVLVGGVASADILLLGANSARNGDTSGNVLGADLGSLLAVGASNVLVLSTLLDSTFAPLCGNVLPLSAFTLARSLGVLGANLASCCLELGALGTVLHALGNASGLVVSADLLGL